MVKVKRKAVRAPRDQKLTIRLTRREMALLEQEAALRQRTKTGLAQLIISRTLDKKAADLNPPPKSPF